MRHVTAAATTATRPRQVPLLGLPGMRVLYVWEFADERHVHIETVEQVVPCTECGQQATSGGRPKVHVRDLPTAGKATRLVWHKREWRCRDCRSSWRETRPDIPPRAALTVRARYDAARQVGEQRRAVAEVARTFGVSWDTVMRAVNEVAAVKFAEQGIATTQTRPVAAFGVDEKVMNRARLLRRRTFVTVLVDLADGTVLDVVEGRSKAVLTGWLSKQTDTWRDGVRIAALDPAAPYRAALTDPRVGLANAQLVVDRFHIVKLANKALDDCRRRVQNETYGHRGRAGEPLYRTRKLLVMSWDNVDERGRERLAQALAEGDRYDEVGCAHMAKELLAEIYRAPDRFAARRRLELFFDWAAEVDVPEVTRLATTIDRWRHEVMAFFTTGRASSGPVEAANGEIEQIDRVARGFRNFRNYRTRILLGTAVVWHTPVTPRLRGPNANISTAAPAFIA